MSCVVNATVTAQVGGSQISLDSLRAVARRVRADWRDMRRTVRGPFVAGLHARRNPRVVMTLLVRDEADIVAANIEHHLDFGVDFIIATDNGSVDGTADILSQYQALGVLELHHEPAGDYRQEVWVTRMARRAASVHGASWVVNSDADEFLWPADDQDKRSLKEILESIEPRHGLIGLYPHHHWPDLSRSGPWPDTAIYWWVGRPGGRHNYWKVMHRGDSRIHVAPGNHYADGPLIGPLSPLSPLRIEHYPDRGLAHYQRKIRNGGSALANTRNAKSRVGIHWREDYDRLTKGTFEADYLARHPSPAQVEELIARGQWAVDTGIPDRLRALLPRARRPELLRAVLGPTGSSSTSRAP